DPGVIPAAELTVRISPANPQAWTLVGDANGNAANMLRRGRTWDKISKQEGDVLIDYYVKWEEAYRTAVRLDPLLGMGWRELAVAATFSGNSELAHRAIWKAVATYPG